MPAAIGPREIGLCAGLASLVLLVAAFGFEFLGGLAPCPLCLWQRWPHGLAAVLGIAVLIGPRRPLALAGIAAMVVGAALAGYHVGIEQGWWTGPESCVAPDIGGLSPEALLERIMNAPAVRCDEVAWRFLGVSMAGWNAASSVLLAGLWGRAYASSSASQ
ncbi:disulfide bond formation protein B [soil metagenome]